MQSSGKLTQIPNEIADVIELAEQAIEEKKEKDNINAATGPTK